jgi:endo-1,4-beta-xylanase
MTRSFILDSTLLWLLGIILIASTSVTPEAKTIATLRSKAQTLKFSIGTAVRLGPLMNDANYAKILAREFNVLTAEDAMKFGAIHPTRIRFDFADADNIVNFATTHGMKVRGHTLVWGRHLPRWLVEGSFSKTEVSAILRHHIETVVGRYRGRVFAWDVVNEAIDVEGAGLRETFWSKMLGSDYIAQALTWAQNADPHAKLFYNDYDGAALGAKSDAIFNLLKSLRVRGLPISGIGLQSHFALETPPKMSDVATNMKRLAALGLEIQVTEFDVRMAMPVTDQELQDQAQIYLDYLSTCLSVANCKAFLSWGFTDKYSWISDFFTGHGAALPFDEEYRPKPAYRAMAQALNNAIRP